MKFIDTSKTVPFDTIEIGHFFYFKSSIWVRNDIESGKWLNGSDGINYNCCNFMMANDNDGEPEQVYAINMEDVTILLANLITESLKEKSNENVD